MTVSTLNSRLCFRRARIGHLHDPMYPRMVSTEPGAAQVAYIMDWRVELANPLADGIFMTYCCSEAGLTNYVIEYVYTFL